MKEKIIKILKFHEDPAEDLNHNIRGVAVFSHLYEDVADEICSLWDKMNIAYTEEYDCDTCRYYPCSPLQQGSNKLKTNTCRFHSPEVIYSIKHK